MPLQSRAPDPQIAAPSAAVAAFERRAAAALLPQPPAVDAKLRIGPSDFDLNPELMAWAARQPAPRAAAVLVPVVAHDAPTVLFTERTAHLPAHAGQISFPGGKIDKTDGGPLATALREAEEEIGLEAAYVTPLGYLDAYRTGTGFSIVPVVALIRPGFSLSPNPGEVADVFEVPLDFLLDTANYQLHTRVWQGMERAFYAIPYDQRYIWGATAGILKNLLRRLTGS